MLTLWGKRRASAPFALDALNTSPTAAYSFRRLFTAYDGPVIRLRRSGDDAESDFGTNANGDLNEAAITAWLGGASAFLVTMYNQVGAANFTQPTAAAQPGFAAGGGDYGGSHRLFRTTELPTQPGAVYVTLQADAKDANRVYWGTSGGTSYALAFVAVTTGRATTQSEVPLRVATSTKDLVDGSPHLCEHIWSASARRARVDGADLGSAATGNYNCAQVSLGSWSTVLWFDGRIWEVVEFGVDLELAEHLDDRNLIGAASAYWGCGYSPI